MIEVNFFEKEAKNVLPHLMGLIFFLGLVAIGVYFFLLHGLYTMQHNQNEQLIAERSEEVAFSRQIESIELRTEESQRVLENLESQQYPLVYLIEDIISTIPDDEDTLVSFESSQGNQLVLRIDGTEISETAELMRSFESVSYVDRLNLQRLEQVSQDSDEYAYELTLNINEEELREVTTSDD